MSSQPKRAKKNKNRRGAILTHDQRELILDYMREFHFMSQEVICDLLEVSPHSLIETRCQDKEFDRAVKQAQTKLYYSCQQSLADLATGNACKITREYKRQYNKDKSPVVDEDGKPVFTETARRVEKFAPSESAIIAYLDRFCTDQREDEALDPDQLRERLLAQLEGMPRPKEKVTKLKDNCTGDTPPQIKHDDGTPSDGDE